MAVIVRLAIGVVMALAFAVPADAYPGDGRYPLPPVPREADRITDVAVLSDGGVVAAASESTWLLPMGATSWQGIPRLEASAVAATPDGGLLAVGDSAIASWRPGTAPAVVAGTDQPGFSGDGGPATSARLGLSFGDPPALGIAPAPQGGFLFTDTSNNRVRAVDSGGTIRTVAGTGKGAPSTRRTPPGEGGPASAARVTEPVALAFLPDGGYLILESAWDRLRRVGPDGVIRTLERGDSPDGGGDLIPLADGRVLVIRQQEARWVLGTGPPGRAFPGLDVAGRGFGCVDAGGSDPASLFIVDCLGRVWWLPGGGRAYRAAAIRDVRVDRDGLEVVAEAAAAGRVALRVRRRGRRSGPDLATETPGGHVAIGRSGRLAADWYRLQVSLDGGWGDGIDVWGGRRLTRRVARRFLRPSVAGGDIGISIYLGRRCRAYGSRRVDCEVKFFEDFGGVGLRCHYVASVVLPRTGIPKRRGYACGDRKRARFRARPDWRPQLAARLSPR